MFKMGEKKKSTYVDKKNYKTELEIIQEAGENAESNLKKLETANK